MGFTVVWNEKSAGLIQAGAGDGGVDPFLEHSSDNNLFSNNHKCWFFKQSEQDLKVLLKHV